MASELRVDKIIPTGGVPTGGGGGIIQITQGSTNNRVETSSQTFVESNLSGTITPKFNTSKIFVQVSADVNNNGAGNNIILTLYRSIGGGGFSNIGHSTYGFTQLRGDGSRVHTPVYIGYLDSPSTTSAVTYKVYVRKTAAGSGNVEFPAQNGQNSVYIHMSEVSA